MDDEKIWVLDAGVRYGIHPTFRKLKNLQYYGFDPDLSEIERLKIKYKSKKNYYFINKALSSQKGKHKYNILRHKGQSSLLIPDKSSYWNKFIRKDECKIIGTENVLSTTIDDFAKEEKINFDFIKSDTEGYDLNVLRGGDETMKRVLGVRCEIHFANNFKGGSNFSEIH